MKKNYILLLLLSILFVYTTNAQITLSNNVGSTIIPGASVSCPGGDNHFARQFTLADFGVTGEFQLTSGEFGIETINGIERNITVNVYSSDGNFPTSLPGALLGTQVVNVPATTPAASVISYSFTTPITLATTETYIVVELVQGVTDATALYIGATAEQTSIAYLKSDACSLDTYGNPADLGDFPGAFFYIVVSGDILGIEEFGLNSLSIFPNPVNNVINIESPNAIKVNNAIIYSITGQVVLEVQNRTKLDVSNLNSGIYLLKIETDNGSITRKIIKN
ncbi:T9SS type A sorting domain-containing protein [Bizionia arctica]|uniref:Secretion system C-terminal sorting domain-containing protein n=1 Tax=Bizionia arctica TaxID=1495645 RepID=A0A917GWD2_9FLAO|nr:T9SS type A sorting domain-containing protein [Bizionia arctica]GGG59258.1 hypothetical protein GCM10010976_32510 [Bizionia arctica]